MIDRDAIDKWNAANVRARRAYQATQRQAVRKSTRKPIDVAEGMRLRALGMSYAQAAKALGCNPSGLFNAIRREAQR